MIHLDTSVLIGMLYRGSPVARYLETIDPDTPLAVSAVAWAEFLCGPIEPAEQDLVLRVVDVHRTLSVEHARVAARLFNRSGRRQNSLSDCLIAAAAILDQAPLATANVADFRRFETLGLKLSGIPRPDSGLRTTPDPRGP